MNLDMNNRMTRLFFWSLGIVSEFLESGYEYRYKKRTNLCHFVRVIFLYMPFVLLVQFILVFLAVFAVVLLPIYLFGAGWYFGVILGASIVVGAIFMMRLKKEAIKIAIGSIGVKRTETAEAKREVVQKGPSMLDIIILWLKAQKQKVCPLINFQGGR